MSSKNDPGDVSRRDLIKLAGTTAAVAGLTGGCVSSGTKGATSGRTPCRGQRAGHLTTKHDLDADVVVVGGGMSGIHAAIAAARAGASVVLLQDRHVLGGNASSEIRMHVCGADASGGRTDTDARESGIIEEIRLEDSVRNPQRSASMYDLLLYEWVTREPNIKLMLNTACFGVQMNGDDRIAAVLASRHSTDDTFAIRGKLFIDCTGDGRLGAEAGALFRMGRESKDEYGESLAPAKADKKTLGSTLLFITREHDRPMPFVAPDFIHKFPSCEDLPHRRHGSWEYGYWWVEWGGELDTIKDNERIRDELTAAALGVWDHIKNSGAHPQSANWALDWFGLLPGKRESRRFVGPHVLTQQEVQRGEVFEDGVAYGGWPIDLHPPGGIYSKEPPFLSIKVPLFNIPLGCLYSRNIRNLLFAGRNISASHAAFGSTRVMATCSVMGQAVGTAAAMCAQRGTLPDELRRDGIGELQQLLLKNDAYIIGVTNNDPDDLARSTQITASSAAAGGQPAKVVNGIHRGIGKERNGWVSDPKQAMPQSIELRFKKLERVSEVQLVFDTGLSRPRTLSHSDRFVARMIQGPQPETVRDYKVQLLEGDSAKTVAEITGNHQRKRIHSFNTQTANGIRLVVNATNGDQSARVFEIRAYS